MLRSPSVSSSTRRLLGHLSPRRHILRRVCLLPCLLRHASASTCLLLCLLTLLHYPQILLLRVSVALPCESPKLSVHLWRHVRRLYIEAVLWIELGGLNLLGREALLRQ